MRRGEGRNNKDATFWEEEKGEIECTYSKGKKMRKEEKKVEEERENVMKLAHTRSEKRERRNSRKRKR